MGISHKTFNSNLTKFHETNEILLVEYFAFVQLQCTLLTFCFTFGAFESGRQNFGFVQRDSKF